MERVVMNVIGKEKQGIWMHNNLHNRPCVITVTAKAVPPVILP